VTYVPVQVTEPYDWPALLALIQTEFAYMEGRIDPPSSMGLLTAGTIAAQAGSGEVWVIEHHGLPVACVFLTPRTDALYIGKLAVTARHRGKNLARTLVDQAENRARALNLAYLELQTRVELTENHAVFTRLGFAKIAETAHSGYDRPTSITMRRAVNPS